MRYNGNFLLQVMLIVVFGALSVSVLAEEQKPLTIKTPCPDKPNCVSSLANTSDEEHYIENFKVASAEDLVKLKEKIMQLNRYELVSETKDTLHFEYTSLIFRFVDDMIFFYDSDKGVIEVRSSSRVGHSDLGANRKRVEEIRKLVNK